MGLLVSNFLIDWPEIYELFNIGYVFKALDKETDQIIAVKRTEKAGEFVSREFEILSKLRNCKNVVRLLDIYYSRSENN